VRAAGSCGGFGRDISRYTERKRVVLDQNLGRWSRRHDPLHPLHALRALRPGYRRLQELGHGRGEHMQIGTYIERSVDHECQATSSICVRSARSTASHSGFMRGLEMTSMRWSPA